MNRKWAMQKNETHMRNDRIRDPQSESPTEWTIEVGEKVVMSHRTGVFYAGLVVDRTADGSTIWIRTDLNERKLFHCSDGYSACPITSSS
jgi:hypothetical protein